MTQYLTPGDIPWREKPALPADYPVTFLPRNLWIAADKAGYDMRFFKIVEPMPSIPDSPTRGLRPGQKPKVQP